MDMNGRRKRPGACVPCHERKVRCDSINVGTPCSRCVSKQRAELCVLVANSGRARQHVQGSVWRPSEPQRDPSVLIQGQSADTDNDHDRPESTATTPRNLDNLHPADEAVPSLEASPNPNNSNRSHDSRRIVIDYYNTASPFIILGSALQQPTRCGLVETFPQDATTLSAKDRELLDLDPIDQAYLAQKKVYEFPPSKVCDALVHLFLTHIYTYIPILDRPSFIIEYKENRVSTFLLYAIFATVIPYASNDVLQGAGYTSVAAAQGEFFQRARLLYDFGCERKELTLLQGSAMLGSFQHSFEPSKSFRFWYGNATRLASQMGLHKQIIENEVDATTLKLCRRIWWSLVHHDVLFSIAGYGSARRLYDMNTDTPPIQSHDLLEQDCQNPFISPLSQLQNSYFVETCNLVQIETKFLCPIRSSTPPPSQTTAFNNALSTWRASLPPYLHLTSDTHYTRSNVWILVLHMLAFQLEAVFYRTVLTQEHDPLSPNADPDPDTKNWLEQRLFSTIFECTLVLRRAIVYDVAQHAPAPIIDCTAQIVALQIEVILNPNCSSARKSSLLTDIRALVQYLDDIGKRWPHARLYVKTFVMAMRKKGLDVGAFGV